MLDFFYFFLHCANVLEGWSFKLGEWELGFTFEMTCILFPVLHDYAESRL